MGLYNKWSCSSLICSTLRACFLPLAQIKLRLCSANHRPGYWSNLPCDWPSTAWVYSWQETENESWFNHPQGTCIHCCPVNDPCCQSPHKMYTNLPFCGDTPPLTVAPWPPLHHVRGRPAITVHLEASPVLTRFMTFTMAWSAVTVAGAYRSQG